MMARARLASMKAWLARMERLNERILALEEGLADAAHDVRSPLQAVIGNAELLARDESLIVVPPGVRVSASLDLMGTPVRASAVVYVERVRANEQEVPHLPSGDQVVEKVQSRRVQPLEIIQEKRERMFGARKHRQEPPEDHLKTALRIPRG